MLKRKITDTLCEWKADPQHKPLIIKGPRQCGKTFSVLDFAKNNYKNIVYLNFFENQSYKDIFAGCLQWIEDAGIIARCYNLSITELPLDGNAIPEIFKVYMRDTGLFISMLEDGTQADVLQGNLYAYKGAIFENLMADFFAKAGRKLYYYHKDSGLEIDFVTRYEGRCTLVEVKAKTGNAKSLKTVLKHPEKYHVFDALKFGEYNIGRQGQVLTLPLYMGAFI